ncbi:hypothetical protein B0F90DRAFT_1758688 [Multifurca ochricompacta]|uniref:Uncharacterized protein n=1 Tax=Multifurca ochricompacta TaxID=376703 RepID=A0AAD4LY69_9AGAM|nr:hypothetical protein B0F90DRAFT_1758688 [Multifurca ochricompacta]
MELEPCPGKVFCTCFCFCLFRSSFVHFVLFYFHSYWESRGFLWMDDKCMYSMKNEIIK